MDMNALIKLAQEPRVRQLVMSVMPSPDQRRPVDGLMDSLREAGMDTQVRSWVGTGPNESITAEQVTAAFGPEHVARAAQDAGCSPDEAADQLSRVLPRVVDTATPGGRVPPPGEVDTLFARLFGAPDPRTGVGAR